MQLPAVTDGTGSLLKNLLSWNCYLRYVKNKVIKQLQCKQKDQQRNDDQEKREFTSTFCRIYNILFKNLTKNLKPIIINFFVLENIYKNYKNELLLQYNGGNFRLLKILSNIQILLFSM